MCVCSCCFFAHKDTSFGGLFKVVKSPFLGWYGIYLLLLQSETKKQEERAKVFYLFGLRWRKLSRLADTTQWEQCTRVTHESVVDIFATRD